VETLIEEANRIAAEMETDENGETTAGSPVVSVS
jgi:(E)-4-hydroxy-3-methylbut-2-enyl-diphosphate synthase